MPVLNGNSLDPRLAPQVHDKVVLLARLWDPVGRGTRHEVDLLPLGEDVLCQEPVVVARVVRDSWIGDTFLPWK